MSECYGSLTAVYIHTISCNMVARMEGCFPCYTSLSFNRKFTGAMCCVQVKTHWTSFSSQNLFIFFFFVMAKLYVFLWKLINCSVLTLCICDILPVAGWRKWLFSVQWTKFMLDGKKSCTNWGMRSQHPMWYWFKCVWTSTALNGHNKIRCLELHEIGACISIPWNLVSKRKTASFQSTSIRLTSKWFFFSRLIAFATETQKIKSNNTHYIKVVAIR